MRRRFNVSGICFPDRHYMLPPLPRLPTLRGLIEDQASFVLHAPRQSGKSTVLSTLGRTLTEEGRFAALLVSVESGVAFSDRIGMAEDAGIRRLSAYLDRLGEAEGHLVIFDRRKQVSWADKVFIHESAGPSGQRIHVFGS